MDWLRCALPEESPELARQLGRAFLATQVRAALEEALSEPAYAAPRLSRYFRANRKLGSKDRRRASDSVYGIIRHSGLLERAGCRSPGELLEGWIRLLLGDRLEEVESSLPTADYAAALSLPVSIAGQWMERLPPGEAAQLASVLAKQAPVYLRANEAVVDREALQEQLGAEGVETVPCMPANALRVLGRLQTGESSCFRKGLFEVQDLSSQRLCEAIPLRPGERVLDFCAGAGGKSLALAARGAEVFAHDIRKKALRELAKRAARANARIQEGLPKQADVVLVDAPCSGTGRLRREPAIRWRFRIQDPLQHLTAQRELLERASRHVRPGGRLVYATCSLLEEENTHLPAGWRRESGSLCWPHRQEGDGFFWSVMVRD